LVDNTAFADVGDAHVLAQAIVDTVREPLLVLHGDLHVVAATRSYYRTCQVSREGTQGRFLYSLGAGQWDSAALRRLAAPLHRGRRLAFARVRRPVGSLERSRDQRVDVVPHDHRVGCQPWDGTLSQPRAGAARGVGFRCVARRSARPRRAQTGTGGNLARMEVSP
jgi:hypothetical protein